MICETVLVIALAKVKIVTSLRGNMGKLEGQRVHGGMRYRKQIRGVRDLGVSFVKIFIYLFI